MFLSLRNFWVTYTIVNRTILFSIDSYHSRPPPFLPPSNHTHTHTHTRTHTHTHTETLQEHLFVTVEVKYNANVDEQCIAIHYYKRKRFCHGGQINLSLWFLKQSKFQQLTSISQKQMNSKLKTSKFWQMICFKILFERANDVDLFYWLYQLVPYIGSQKKRGVMSCVCFVR